MSDRAAATVAVFGSSEPEQGSPAYELARSVGRRLAHAGYTVLTGGYGGVMEAASRGASEGGGRVEGVTCTIFSHRAPNGFIDRAIETPDLFARQAELVQRSDAFAVLPGKAGTLSELALLWALHRTGCLASRPVVLLGEVWGPFLEHLREHDMIDRAQLDIAHLSHSPEQLVQNLDRRLRGPRGG